LLPLLNPLSLTDWRRRVTALYGDLRAASGDCAGVARRFRAERDRLFKEHPATPLLPQQQAGFAGLAYYPYDPAWRVLAQIKPLPHGETFEADLGDEGHLRFADAARVHFQIHGETASLAVYWLLGYGGGLWLPFADASNGHTTYGGGRYLLDTIKGADLGTCDGRLILDFNYAYNPSCAYNPRWLCPLAPHANTLAFAVTAGERKPNF
jgi:uncharacterized protein (DUF1684 family)